MPLRSRRQQPIAVIQKLQHVLPSPVLVGDGLRRFGDGAGGWNLALATGEIVAGVLVIGSFLYLLRQTIKHNATDHAHSAVDWVDLFLAAMLLVEVIVHHHETGRIQRPTLLLSATMLLFGLTHGRLAVRVERHRTLRVDEAGVTSGEKFFRRFTARWSEDRRHHDRAHRGAHRPSRRSRAAVQARSAQQFQRSPRRAGCGAWRVAGTHRRSPVNFRRRRRYL